jgi:hypothetical protein
MSDFAAKLAELDKRAEACRARLFELGTSRRDLVIAACENDEGAIRKVMELDAETVRKQQELTLLGDAQAEIETKQRAEAEAKGKEEQQRREQEAKELTIDVMAVCNQVDQQLIVLRQLFQRRLELMVALQRTRTKPDGFMQRLIGSKYAATGAARAAGLEKFLDLAHIEPRHPLPLVETNRALSPVPAPAANKRFRLTTVSNEKRIG